MSKLKYAIAKGGARLAVDDSGKIVWVTGTHRGMQTEFARRADAEVLIASYSAISRAKMRIVEVR